MAPLFGFIARRFLLVPLSLLVITLVLYAGVMLTPPEARARLYLPKGRGAERASPNLIRVLIRNYHLDAPYPVQYGIWVGTLLQGNWGYSPSLRAEVLPLLLSRTPATLELLLYSLAFVIPLGLLAGLVAGWRRDGVFDGFFRTSAYVGTSLPPFILAMVLLSAFYITLNWFMPGRLSQNYAIELRDPAFRSYTGMVTLDALVNGRFDILADALRHLAMPVLTLGLYHLATLGRLTRSLIVAEKNKEYIVAARARGLTERAILWRHAFSNVLAPSLTGVALSAASLMTGVFVVEIIFGLRGVSDVIVIAMHGVPDAQAALGFAVYSVIFVLLLMFVLDVLQALFDPRVRDEVLRP